ncbi:MAG TPA: PDZ domain-containing protein, partial [Thermoanaerobaculia bacterium]|nr:PDZ domain-containing protein [Thermoanaerobaculia bacterium]
MSPAASVPGFRLAAPTLLAATIAGLACSTTPPPKAAAPAARASLGIVAAPISRAARRKLGLAEAAPGAIVVEVLAGGPGAAAGVRPDDVIERIGDAAIANVCDFDATADDREPGAVRVAILRGGKSVDLDVVATDRRALFEQACRSGSAAACGLLARFAGDGAGEESACRSGSADSCANVGI